MSFHSKRRKKRRKEQTSVEVADEKGGKLGEGLLLRLLAVERGSSSGSGTPPRLVQFFGRCPLSAIMKK